MKTIQTVIVASTILAGCAAEVARPLDAGVVTQRDGPPVDRPATQPDQRRVPGPDLRQNPDARPDTTIKGDIRQPGPPCKITGYSGWRCLTLTIPSSIHGVSFSVAARWNMATATPKASVLWLLGGVGTGKFRVDYNAAAIQDKLASADGIRSVELEFTDPPDKGSSGPVPSTGGYFRAPRRGYPDTGAVYTEAVRQAWSAGIAAGGWLTHIGGSNGAMLAAAGLSRSNLAFLVKRYIFASGPFAALLAPQCSNSKDYTYIDNTGLRTLVDLWNGWDAAGHKYCETGASAASPSYSSRSLLGSGATTSYSKVSLMVLMGDQDAFAPWIIKSNEDWFHRVGAGKKRRYVLESVGHDTFAGPGVTLTPQIQKALDLVYTYARRKPLSEPGIKPQMLYSKSKGGATATLFSTSDTLHGQVTGGGASARACMEGPLNPGACAQLKNWSAMPKKYWSYNATTQIWRCAAPLSTYKTGRYRSWWQDKQTGEVSERVEFTVQ